MRNDTPRRRQAGGGPDEASDTPPRRTVESHVAQPLNLAWFILWTSGCAVYFAAARSFLPNPPSSGLGVLWLSLLAAVTSGGWVSLGALTRYSRSRANRDRLPPTVYLLGCLGCVLTADLLLGSLPSGSPWNSTILRTVVAALMFTLPVLSRNVGTHWKIIAVAILALQVLPVWDAVFRTTFTPASAIEKPMAIVAGALILAMVMQSNFDARDGSKTKRMGTLHWLGLLLVAIWLVLDYIAQPWNRLF